MSRWLAAAAVLVACASLVRRVAPGRRDLVRSRLVRAAAVPPPGSARSAGGRPPGWAASAVVGSQTLLRTVLATVGRFLRRLRGRPSDPRADLVTGATVVALAVGSVVSPLLGVVAAAAIPSGAALRSRAARRRARDALLGEVPDVVELFLVAARAG